MANKLTQPVMIDGIPFDALIDSEEVRESEIPAYPVETGFEVSDTIILKSLVLNMSLYLTNTPVTWKERNGSGPFKVQDILQQLEDLYFTKTPVTVSTNERDYENMGIVKIGLPKKIETGTSRLIPISFKQIRVAEAQTTSIPASLGRGGDTGTNAGTASTTPGQGTGGGGSSSGNDGSRSSILYNVAGAAGLLGR